MAALEWLMAPQAAELEELVRRPAWQARAACRGTSLGVFFPEKKGDYAPAKAMCAECPVRQECLAAALADPGIAGCWGGTSRRERARVARSQESQRPARLLAAVASPNKPVVKQAGTRVASLAGDEEPRPELHDADCRVAFHHHRVATLIVTPDGRTLAANLAACRLFARSEADLCSLGWASVQDPADLRWATALAEQELTGRFSATLRIRRKYGTIVESEIRSSVYLDDDGLERNVVTLTEPACSPPTWRQPLNREAANGMFTEAELRVLELLPTHYSMGQMAEMLFVARNTVKTHVLRVYRKLGVHDRASAVAQATALGILAQNRIVS